MPSVGTQKAPKCLLDPGEVVLGQGRMPLT